MVGLVGVGFGCDVASCVLELDVVGMNRIVDVGCGLICCWGSSMSLVWFCCMELFVFS